MDGTAPQRFAARPRIDVEKLFDRLPPHAPEAEMSLLGSIILDPRALVDVLDHVQTGDDFYSAAHGVIFDALREIADRNPETDLVELTDRLRDRAELEGVGGSEYLVQLAESVPSAVNAPHYARMVADKARLRRLIKATSEILFDAYHVGGDGPEDVKQAIDAAEMKIFEIARAEDRAAFANLASLLQEELDRIEAVEGRLVSGLHTGYDDLDEKLSGLQAGEMLIIAARPSMGKCLAHDSEIVLKDGRVATIEQIVREQAGPIFTLGDDYRLGWATPSAFIDDGVKPVYEVVTRLGRRIVTTLTHPFLTIDGWKPLADLIEGDHVAVPRTLDVFGDGDMRECEVKLLAYLIGDGGLTGLNPRFTSSSPAIAREFAQAVEAFGAVRLKLSSTREDESPSWRISAIRDGVATARRNFGARLSEAITTRGVTARTVAAHMGVTPATLTHWTQGKTAPARAQALRLCEFLEVAPEWLCPDGVDAMRRNQPNAMTRWLTDLGLMGAGAADKHIPEQVFTLRRELLAMFLNRLFATDGWATVLKSGQAQLGYATVSERLARQVQHLLLRFGVVASLRQRWVKYRDARRVSWQLDITDAHSIRRFAGEIGIFSKEDRLAAAVEAVDQKRYQTNRDLIPVGVWKRIEQAKGDLSWAEVARRAGASSKMHVGVRAPTRARMAQLARALASEELQSLADSDVYWDRIVSITPAGMQQVYDLTIPQTHNFVANDVCVHNTALALNLAEQVAMGGRTPWTRAHTDPVPVGFFSLEMSRNSLAQRLLSAYSGVDSHKMRTGQINDQVMSRLIEACGALSQAPIIVDDTPNMTVMQLRARARRMVDRHGVKALFIDYLQLMTAPGAGRESRQVEVSTISRGIKALARELSLPVICLAQLNRGSEQREGNRPRMSDLRESGSIEQDADVVMLLHRESYYHQADPGWLEENEDKVNDAELIIAKQRNGPTGVVHLTWDARTTRFKSRARLSGDFDGGYYDSGPAAGADFGPPAASYAPGGGGGGGAASHSAAPFEPVPRELKAPSAPPFDERGFDDDLDGLP